MNTPQACILSQNSMLRCQSFIWAIIKKRRFMLSQLTFYNIYYIIREIQQKMTNRNAELPRSLKFQESSMRNFVQGSSFLNANSHLNLNYTGPLPIQSTKENYMSNNKFQHPPSSQNMLNTHSNFNHKPLGFDAYNKNNLLLKACDAGDIQYVQKNPVVFQEDIVVDVYHPKTTNNIPSTKAANKQSSRTAQNFYKKIQNKNQEQLQYNKKSNQAVLNDFLFNYRKQEEEKKNKKLKFLQEVENRINNLERQTEQLQEEKGKQYKQLNDILKIQSEATQNVKRANLIGKINMAIHEADLNPKQNLSPPQRITEDMGHLQIDMAIEQQHEYNEALLGQVQRVSRSKSKERVENNWTKSQFSPKKAGSSKVSFGGNQKSSLSKTLKRPMQVPPKPTSKKLMTTWKGK